MAPRAACCAAVGTLSATRAFFRPLVTWAWTWAAFAAATSCCTAASSSVAFMPSASPWSFFRALASRVPALFAAMASSSAWAAFCARVSASCASAWAFMAAWASSGSASNAACAFALGGLPLATACFQWARAALASVFAAWTLAASSSAAGAIAAPAFVFVTCWMAFARYGVFASSADSIAFAAARFAAWVACLASCSADSCATSWTAWADAVPRASTPASCAAWKPRAAGACSSGG